jgi:NAD(P)-dependent dehydrogenase (short-subunit alcohol dehydrogenase family)
MAEMFDLTRQVAVVTGGTGRLGAQFVSTLAGAGAWVAAFDIHTQAAPEVFGSLGGAGRISVHKVDIIARESVKSGFDEVIAQQGTPTILVNCGGIGAPPGALLADNGPFETYPEASWDAFINSHLKGTFLVSQEFVRRYRLAGCKSGSIINVSSTYGVVTPDQSVYEYRRRRGEQYFKPVAYSVAKSGVLNFTRWLAEYGAPLGIRVNTLVPGGVREDGHDPEFVAEYERRTPLGRMAAASEYNGAVLFMASEKASGYMTGATLVVDGGWTAR